MERPKALGETNLFKLEERIAQDIEQMKHDRQTAGIIIASHQAALQEEISTIQAREHSIMSQENGMI